MSDQSTNNQSPNNDVSRRALSAARFMDRLSEGEYILILDKTNTQWILRVVEQRERAKIIFDKTG